MTVLSEQKAAAPLSAAVVSLGQPGWGQTDSVGRGVGEEVGLEWGKTGEEEGRCAGR